MGIDHIYGLIGMKKWKFLFMHMRQWDTTDKLFLISIQHTKLECGSETLFFNFNRDEWGSLVANTWNTHLWEYYDNRRITMNIDKPVIYEKLRQRTK